MDGFDYDIWYKGQVIANIKAFSDEEAAKLAQMMYIICTVSRSSDD